jgi:hypothetical protein
MAKGLKENMYEITSLAGIVGLSVVGVTLVLVVLSFLRNGGPSVPDFLIMAFGWIVREWYSKRNGGKED